MADHYDAVHVDDGEGDALSRGDSSVNLGSSDDDDCHHPTVDCSDVSSQNSNFDHGDNDNGDGDDRYEEDDGDDNSSVCASPGLSIGEAILSDIQTTHAAAEKPDSKRTQGKATECCVCGARALYTCPGCGRRTCSMTCVRVHKDDFHCSGERDLAAKIPLSEFSDQQLQRDFHFLEDCRRVADNVERGFPRSMWRFTYRALPPPLHALREAARRRGVICQITSEGMQKRDANTSRLDRKTNTIVWRCEFCFVDARHPDESVMIGTNWGSERHHLGDIMKYCWATNPPLLCYHINRQYNRAAKYVSGASDTARTTAEAAESGDTAAQAVDDTTGEATNTVAPPPHPEETPTPANTTATTADGNEDVHDDATSGRLGEPHGLTSVVEGEATPTPLHAYEVVPPMPPIEPVSAEEAAQQAYVNAFLAHEPYVILSKAERLGSATKYFRLVPHETLNETLRRLFFVNEFPVFVVVHASLLDRFPLVTEADKETIRGSFRSNKTPREPRVKAPVRTRSDLTPEELSRLAKVPCRRFLHSRCQLGEECPYWHCTPEEIPVCRSFLRTGQCDKGTRCSFRHDPEAVRLARRRQREEGRGGRGRGGGGGGGFRGGRGGRGGFRGSRGPRQRVE